MTQATVDQIRTFWAQLADRRWDDLSQRLPDRPLRQNYLQHIWKVYMDFQADEVPTLDEMMAIITDLYAFKGYEIERRLRRAR